jgi:hypothetical protein
MFFAEDFLIDLERFLESMHFPRKNGHALLGFL